MAHRKAVAAAKNDVSCRERVVAAKERQKGQDHLPRDQLGAVDGVAVLPDQGGLVLLVVGEAGPDVPLIAAPLDQRDGLVHCSITVDVGEEGGGVDLDATKARLRLPTTRAM